MNLLVLNYEYPPLGGGAGVITQNISEQLAAFGHKVTVVTTWYKTEKEIEEMGNLKIIRLKSKRKHMYKSTIWEMLSWIRVSKQFLKNYCKEEKFDLCFANFTIPGGIVALFLKRKFGLKYTIISHGHDVPWRYPKQMLLFHIITYFRIKKICMRSEINLVLTKEMKRNIDNFLGEKFATKNVLIPNGIDRKVFKPDYSRRDKRFKIMFTGRLVLQKDPFTFLKAIALFSKKNKEFIVHIIGDGVLRNKMEEFIVTQGIEENIKLLGWINQEEILKEYQSSHISVISSVFEGMSVVALESVACGCYLISTPVDGIQQMVNPNENGFIVNFHSAEEIAEQLEHYYNKNYKQNYLVPEMVIDRLLVEFDWNKIGRMYEAEFQKLLNV